MHSEPVIFASLLSFFLCKKIQVSPASTAKSSRLRKIIIGSLIAMAVAITIVIIVFFAIGVTPEYEVNDEYKLLAQFIQTPSLSGSETKMGELLYSWLKAQGWVVQKQEVTADTFNVFAHRGNADPK